MLLSSSSRSESRSSTVSLTVLGNFIRVSVTTIITAGYYIFLAGHEVFTPNPSVFVWFSVIIFCVHLLCFSGYLLAEGKFYIMEIPLPLWMHFISAEIIHVHACISHVGLTPEKIASIVDHPFYRYYGKAVWI